MKNDNIVFLDVETTGNNPEVHEVAEVSMIYWGKPSDSEGSGIGHLIEERWVEQTFFVPANLGKAQPDALRVNRLIQRGYLDYLASVKQLPGDWPRAIREAAAQVVTITAGKFLASDGVSFDVSFLKKLIRGAGLCHAWDRHQIDINSYAAGALGLQPPWKGKDLGKLLNVPEPGEADRHTALGDARWHKVKFETAQVYLQKRATDSGVFPVTRS